MKLLYRRPTHLHIHDIVNQSVSLYSQILWKSFDSINFFLFSDFAQTSDICLVLFFSFYLDYIRISMAFVL